MPAGASYRPAARGGGGGTCACAAITTITMAAHWAPAQKISGQHGDRLNAELASMLSRNRDGSACPCTHAKGTRQRIGAPPPPTHTPETQPSPPRLSRARLPTCAVQAPDDACHGQHGPLQVRGKGVLRGVGCAAGGRVHAPQGALKQREIVVQGPALLPAGARWAWDAFTTCPPATRTPLQPGGGQG